MPKLIGTVLVASLLAGLLASSAMADNPTSATNCPLTEKEKQSLGPSYVSYLGVEGVTCDQGKRIAVAFHNCRTNGNGTQGRCHHKVRRYTCPERRYDVRPGVRFSASVTCSRGSRRVLVSYTQYT